MMAFGESLISPAFSFYPAAIQAVSEHRRTMPPSPSIMTSTIQTAAVAAAVKPLPSRRVPTLSSYNPHLAHLLLQLVQTPRILAQLLSHLDWVTVYALLCTCKALHDHLFMSMPHLDVLLSRFVPGYAYGVRQRDFALYQDVPISLHELDLLLISLKTPLHQYPTHSLHLLGALYPTYEDDLQSGKLIRLTQAHTRFVLLLQSIVHSCPYPIPPDPPGPADDNANGLYGILNGSPAGVTAGPPPRIPSRELVFPAPLAYPVVASHSKSAPRISPTFANSYISSRPRPTTTSSHNDNFNSPDGPRKRRLSLLSKNGVHPPMPPPPPEEPRAMKMYSDTWRRRSSIRLAPSGGLAHGRSFSLDQVNPHLRQSNSNLNAVHQNGRTSRSSESISSFYAPSPPFAFPTMPNRSSHTPSPPPIFRAPSPLDLSPTPQTIHALRSSLSRTRAPILRVFVPTHALNSDALEACERQLRDSGAWEHMSVGDIVCNFGYVPGSVEPSPDPEPLMRGTGINRAGGGWGGEIGEMEGYSSSESEDSLVRRNLVQNQGRRWSSGSVLPSYPPIYQHQQQTSSWLLFDGEMLIPYTPPDLLHIPNPLSLPSPFYYSHLLAQHLNLNPNPRFVLDRLPIFAPILPQPAPAHGARHRQHSHSYSYGQRNGNGNAHTPTGVHVPQPPPKPRPPTPPPKSQKRNSNLSVNQLPTRPLPPLPSHEAQKRDPLSPLSPLPSPLPPFPSQSFHAPPPTQTTAMAMTMTQITLTQTTSKVPSPLSPTGYLSVKQFVWTGAVRVIASQPGFLLPLGLGPPPLPQSQNQSKSKYSNANTNSGQGLGQTMSSNMLDINATAAQNAEQALGSAWHGTWVFEVEGTKEGHEMLLSLLAGRMPSFASGAGDNTAGAVVGGTGKVLIAQGEGQRRAGLLCEVVRERSGGGVIWIRVLPM